MTYRGALVPLLQERVTSPGTKQKECLPPFPRLGGISLWVYHTSPWVGLGLRGCLVTKDRVREVKRELWVGRLGQPGSYTFPEGFDHEF